MSRLLLFACLLIPEILLGFTRNPPGRRSGVPTDDAGATCVACHRTFVTVNPDTVGSVTVETADTYMPGVAQTVKVTVSHPQALKWGFQLTARQVNNTNDQAGSFTGGADVITRCDGTGASCEGARASPSSLRTQGSILTSIASTHFELNKWIPACAGMTKQW